MNAQTVNQATKAGTAKAERDHLATLEKVYLRLIRAAGRRAAEAFVAQTTLVAAVNPKWVPPTAQLIDAEQLTADAQRKTARPHELILRDVTAADEIGISWDINHPTSQQLLANVASRLESLNAALRLQVSETIQDGYAQGWSVARTAAAIVEKVDEVAPGRAETYARTDLVALSNGGSLMAAQIVGVAAKTWLATEDERTRETHAQADGQTVGLDQMFDVGGEQASYPGDPGLSDEESYNCRCTITFSDDLTASAAPDLEQAMVAGMLPIQVTIPPQKPPTVHVAAPEVHVTNDQPAPDMSGVERVLEQIGPLLASVADGQRSELVETLQALRAAVERDAPRPEVTVAAAEVQLPDLSGIGPAIVDGLSPAAQEGLTLLRALLDAINSRRTRRVSVVRDRSGEITDLLITDE